MFYCMVNFWIEYDSEMFMRPTLRKCYLYIRWIFFAKIFDISYGTRLALYDMVPFCFEYFDQLKSCLINGL